MNLLFGKYTIARIKHIVLNNFSQSYTYDMLFYQ
uniref:Helioarmicin B n=1 Tax=Helicoverpa armigera TaxID=29058 RepID=Q86MY0_HELAM|nr:helioarmicin B [Helicoverpa armigera]